MKPSRIKYETKMYSQQKLMINNVHVRLSKKDNSCHHRTSFWKSYSELSSFIGSQAWDMPSWNTGLRCEI